MIDVRTRTATALALFGCIGAAAAAPFEMGCTDDVDVDDTGELARFDAELRRALETSNVDALAALVQYPLRINGIGTRSIDDPRALQADAGEVFGPAIRAAVLETQPADVACIRGSVMYGGGRVWARPTAIDGTLAYRIWTVNLPDAPAETKTTLEFVCETKKHRVIVDVAGSTHRYRAWNKPRALGETPDMELNAEGVLEYEGTGACSRRLWRFARGDTAYVVGELGCTDGSEPDGTRGSLDVEIKGENASTAWCR